MKQSQFKRILKRTPKYLGLTALVIIFLLAIVPFLIPVKPIDGLVSNKQMAVSESNFITIPFAGTDGIDLHYFDSGLQADSNSKTFVLLHGFVFNSFTWNEVMDTFSEQGRVVAYDQIPYGLSEKLLTGDWSEANPYTSEAATERLFLFIEALGLNNVVLVGNSYGATLAARAAVMHPERIDAMILVDPAVYVQEEMPAWILGLPQVQRMGPLLARGVGQNESFIRQTYLNPDQIDDERMGLTTIHTQIENWDEALWEYLNVWKAPDLTAGIQTIGQPVLVIAGDSDAIVPIADSQKLDAALQKSELVILESCGHVPQEECPVAFEEAIVSWLETQ